MSTPPSSCRVDKKIADAEARLVERIDELERQMRSLSRVTYIRNGIQYGVDIAGPGFHAKAILPPIPDTCGDPGDEPRECGEPHPDDERLVCRKRCAPGRDFHGGGHIFAPPDMTDEQLHEGLRQVVMRPSRPDGDEGDSALEGRIVPPPTRPAEGSVSTDRLTMIAAQAVDKVLNANGYRGKIRGGIRLRIAKAVLDALGLDRHARTDPPNWDEIRLDAPEDEELVR
ncbi:MAG: hypothetical protein ITG02_02425 [Patulibacter sp.]|nr:hypothetical protein [Patulibacter sp.]